MNGNSESVDRLRTNDRHYQIPKQNQNPNQIHFHYHITSQINNNNNNSNNNNNNSIKINSNRNNAILFSIATISENNLFIIINLHIYILIAKY